MEQPQTDSELLLVRDGVKLTTAALADPSVTILEVGDNLGLLLADSCTESGSVDPVLHLENVNWIRRTKRGFLGNLRKRKQEIRSFAKISIHRHESGVFVAQDEASKGHLPSPSEEPYAVVFISKELYDELHRGIEQESFDDLLESVKSATENVAGFSFVGKKLVGPAEYACAETEELKMLGV